MNTPRLLLPAGVIAAAALLCPFFHVSARAQNMDLQVTPEIENAVLRGLDYLARTQNPNGSWPGQGATPGVVGLQVLSFLAHGEIPDQGRYGAVMRRGVQYIISQEQSNGLLAGGGSAMYSHGFATLALAEMYGMIDYPPLGPALKRATDLIVSVQNRLGGWRYNVGEEDADTTVSGCQMVALRAAATACMEVPFSSIQRGVNYFKAMSCPDGGIGYTEPAGPDDARTGIGLLVFSLSGAYMSDQSKGAADWLLNYAWTSPISSQMYSSYRDYYCAQAMLQAGGKYWRKWSDTMTPLILACQQDDGSWPRDPSVEVPLATAFNLLALEVNYYYLPIYQR